MKTMIKIGVSALAIGGGLLAAAPAMAQGAPTVSGNVNLTTDYRFRGVSLSGNEPAIQGGVDLGWDSGFYVGTWGSSIQTFSSNDEIELDFYAGYAGQFGNGLGFDLGVIAYTYPGASSFGDTWYPELYGSIGGDAGVASWTIGAAYAPETDNLTTDNFYGYVEGQVPFGASPFYATAHVGYEDGFFSDKFDWSAGLGVSAAGLNFSVAYVGFDADLVDDDAIVVSIGSSW